MERFPYRVFTSRHGENFVLKVALLFGLWYDAPRRPARDADLLALEARDIDQVTAIFRELCALPCEDGMLFLEDSVHAVEIREDARYGGSRVELIGMLGTARCRVQIDIGYGDVVSPAVELVRLKPILDDSLVAVMKAYPRETVIAEKLEAIVSLGMANLRTERHANYGILAPWAKR